VPVPGSAILLTVVSVATVGFARPAETVFDEESRAHGATVLVQLYSTPSAVVRTCWFCICGKRMERN
jgi:hypothetical protein